MTDRSAVLWYNETMIYLVADHGGYKKKNAIRDWLRGKKIAVTDLGPKTLRPGDDYPIMARALAKAVLKKHGAFGVAVCRSGVGMALAANKIRGVRAAQISSPRMAKKAKADENVNVISLAADFQPLPAMKAIITAALTTTFSESTRAKRRLREIKSIEHGR